MNVQCRIEELEREVARLRRELAAARAELLSARQVWIPVAPEPAPRPAPGPWPGWPQPRRPWWTAGSMSEPRFVGVR